jgi:hypothetical protein
MEGMNSNNVPVAPPLPPVRLAVNIDPKIVQELLDACRSGQADQVNSLFMYDVMSMCYCLAGSAFVQMLFV